MVLDEPHEGLDNNRYNLKGYYLRDGVNMTLFHDM